LRSAASRFVAPHIAFGICSETDIPLQVMLLSASQRFPGTTLAAWERPSHRIALHSHAEASGLFHKVSADIETTESEITIQDCSQYHYCMPSNSVSQWRNALAATARTTKPQTQVRFGDPPRGLLPASIIAAFRASQRSYKKH